MKRANLIFVGGMLAFCLVSAGICTAVWAEEDRKNEATHNQKSQTTEGEKSDDEEVDKDDKSGKRSAKELGRAQMFADQFKVSSSLILELRQKKMGWGEIGHLLILAKKSNQSIETILTLRESGMGWGKIAKKYDLKLGVINREVRAAEKAAFKRVERPGASKQAERPDPKRKHDKPDKQERFEPPEIRGESTERVELKESSYRVRGSNHPEGIGKGR